MKNIKDIATTICGIVIALGGTVLALPTQGVTIPPIVLTVATVAVALAGTIIGLFTGRNPDGSKKAV